MITLQSLFNTLALGELSNTKLNTDGKIAPDNYATLVSHVNLGLIELFKQFNIRQNTVRLYQHPDVFRYYLRVEHLGDVEEMDDWTYLLYDEDEPFKNDLVKVLSITDDLQSNYPINDYNCDYTILTPESDILVMNPVDTPLVPLVFDITYQSLHPVIVFDPKDFKPEDIILHIPAAIEEALLAYIACRVFQGINSSVSEGTTTPAMTYSAKYEMACLKITAFSLVPDNDDSGLQFRKNGWR